MNLDEKIHTYNCDFCDKSFSRRNTFSVHMKRHTNESWEHTCKKCKKGFPSRSDLKRHEVVHLKVRPKLYSCKMCNKSYYKSSSLTRHNRLHTKEKPYQCQLCDLKFSDKSLCLKHEKSHTEVYKCGNCGKQYKWVS